MLTIFDMDVEKAKRIFYLLCRGWRIEDLMMHDVARTYGVPPNGQKCLMPRRWWLSPSIWDLLNMPEGSFSEIVKDWERKR